MSNAIIKVEGLGKQYFISSEKQAGGYTALRDVISMKARSLIKGSSARSNKEEFWALKDVSFEVNEGEAIGIIERLRVQAEERALKAHNTTELIRSFRGSLDDQK